MVAQAGEKCNHVMVSFAYISWADHALVFGPTVQTLERLHPFGQSPSGSSPNWKLSNLFFFTKHSN